MPVGCQLCYADADDIHVYCRSSRNLVESLEWQSYLLRENKSWTHNILSLCVPLSRPAPGPLSSFTTVGNRWNAVFYSTSDGSIHLIRTYTPYWYLKDIKTSSQAAVDSKLYA